MCKLRSHCYEWLWWIKVIYYIFCCIMKYSIIQYSFKKLCQWSILALHLARDCTGKRRFSGLEMKYCILFWLLSVSNNPNKIKTGLIKSLITRLKIKINYCTNCYHCIYCGNNCYCSIIYYYLTTVKIKINFIIVE